MILLISITLISIAAAAAAPSIAQQIKRDREEEMIRRGKQYAEAVKRYYIKFHRYPASIDQLVETNGIHFLRKRYVDPITGKDDWRLVHQGEATIPNWSFGTAAPGIPGGQSPAALGSSPTGMAATNPAGGTSSTASTSAMTATGATTATIGGTASAQGTAGNSTQAGGGTTANGAAPTTTVKPGVGGIVIAELVTEGGTAPGQTPGQTNSQNANQAGAGVAGTNNATNSGSSGGNSAFIGAQSSTTPSGTSTNSSFGSSASSISFLGGTQSAFGNNQPGSVFGGGQQLGGAAIIGVASTSKEQSIREFNGKDHYSDWAFIYDPRLDTRPIGTGAAGAIGQPIAPGQNGGSAFGQPATGAGATSPTPTPPATTTTTTPPTTGGQVPPR